MQKAMKSIRVMGCLVNGIAIFLCFGVCGCTKSSRVIPVKVFGNEVLIGPRDISISDAESCVYVIDGRNRVLKFSDDGKYIGEWNGDRKTGKLRSPSSVCVSPKGVLITDTFNSRIIQLDYKLNRSRIFIGTDAKDDKLKFPQGIRFDAERRLLVCDLGNNRIRRYGADGKMIDDVDNINQIGLVSRVAVGPQNTMLLLSGANCKVQKYDSSGTLVFTMGRCGAKESEFNNPLGLDVDERGYAYVSDAGNDRIIVIDPSGRAIESIGSKGDKMGEFNDPCGIAIFKDKIFVADYGNNRIQILRIK